jgi:hypothetical protein
MRKALPDPAYGAADSALNALRSIGELDILLIDSTVPGAPHGELDTATLAWLDGALAASAARPALLFLHHPPLQHRTLCGCVMLMRWRRCSNATRGRCWWRRVMSVAPRRHVFASVSATICPAGEQAVTLEFEPRWPEVFKIEPQAPHLHAWLPGEGFGSVVTHSAPIGEFPSPYSYGYADTALPRL